LIEFEPDPDVKRASPVVAEQSENEEERTSTVPVSLKIAPPFPPAEQLENDMAEMVIVPLLDFIAPPSKGDALSAIFDDVREKELPWL
jgi:hypothetical protein